MAAKGHSEIVSQLVGPRDTAHPLTALALPVSSHSKLLNRPHPSPRTLRCLFAPRPTTRALHDQPGVPLSTAHRAWGRRGPVLHPKPDEKRVPIVLRPADPCRKLQQPDVTVACPGCWRSCLKHLFSQPQEYPIDCKSHVWNLRKVEARSFRIAADRAWYHPPSGHVERLERKTNRISKAKHGASHWPQPDGGNVVNRSWRLCTDLVAALAIEHEVINAEPIVS